MGEVVVWQADGVSTAVLTLGTRLRGGDGGFARPTSIPSRYGIESEGKADARFATGGGNLSTVVDAVRIAQ
jgi:hypothetical protein